MLNRCFLCSLFCLCLNFSPTANQNCKAVQNCKFADRAKGPQKSKSGIYSFKNHKKSANVSIKIAVADYERGNVKESYDKNSNILINKKTMIYDMCLVATK